MQLGDLRVTQAELELVAQRHQFVDFGDNATLLRQGGKGRTVSDKSASTNFMCTASESVRSGFMKRRFALFHYLDFNLSRRSRLRADMRNRLIHLCRVK